MKYLRIGLTFLALLISAGCSILPNNDEDGISATNDQYRLIAENLVNTLVQIDETNPLATTVQMVKPSNALGEYVFKSVEDHGYGIQLVTGDLGDSYLSYAHQASVDENGFRNTYILSVGKVIIERDYKKEENGVIPISAMVVTASSSQDINIDDTMFPNLEDSSVSRAEFITSAKPVIVSLVKPKLSATKHIVVSHDHANIFDSGHSNYTELFDQYYDIEKQTIIFDNDSMVLGKNNKAKIDRLRNNINNETDIVSVVGCSHGKTNIVNGNQILAEGRTQRVKEAFLFAGTQPELIMDEACWAVDYHEKLPRRGVVVTLKRSKNTG